MNSKSNHAFPSAGRKIDEVTPLAIISSSFSAI